MSDTQSSLIVPRWDGDSNNIPEEGKLFEYEGKTWIWGICSCGRCGLPEVSEAGKATPNTEMTVRIRGTNQGHPTADFIMKSGAVTMDEFAKSFAAGALIQLYRKARQEWMNHRSNEEQWLSERGITRKELNYFLSSAPIR